NAADAVPEDAGGDTDADDTILRFIDNASTHVGLIPLPAHERIEGTVSGTVGGEYPTGTLVVAEGGAQVSYTIADASGHYTLINVPDGATIVGYRQGRMVESVTAGSGDQTGVDLPLVAEGIEALPSVSGSVNIVDAPGGATTSVVLVPASVFNEL